jgi:hypothetical protein
MFAEVPLLAQQLSTSPPALWPVWVFEGVVVALLVALYRRSYRGPAQRAGTGKAGTVYVLTNSQYEQLVKIGYTTRDPRTRAQELSSATGVPGDFSVAHEVRVSDARAVERAVHERLSEHRPNKHREFFAVSPRAARAAVAAEARAYRGGMGCAGGGLLTLTALFGSLSLLIHPPGGRLVKGVSMPELGHVLPVELPLELSLSPSLLGPPGAWIATLCVQHGFGYLTLVPFGLLGLLGIASLRRQSLRPVLGPVLLLLLATLAAASALAQIDPAAASTAVGWAAAPSSPGPLLWGGGGGQALAAAGAAALGSGAWSLTLPLATAAFCLLLAVWGTRGAASSAR